VWLGSSRAVGADLHGRRLALVEEGAGELLELRRRRHVHEAEVGLHVAAAAAHHRVRFPVHVPSLAGPPILLRRMSDQRFRSLAETRWRIAISLTAVMVAIYFGFILLIAYNKPLMGRLVTRGLSVGVLLGALVIVLSWVLTWIYVRWANTHYDAGLEAVRREGRAT